MGEVIRKLKGIKNWKKKLKQRRRRRLGKRSKSREDYGEGR